MTWLERALAAVFPAAPAPQRRVKTVPPPKAAPSVPAEYLSLYTYLDQRYATTVVLTFREIESLLGSALPAAARSESGWWTGADGHGKDHTGTWTEARRTAVPNLQARTVVFERPD